MKYRTPILAWVLVALVCFVAAAPADAVTVWSDKTAASGTGSVYPTGQQSIGFQVCGTGFSGTVTVYQGSRSEALTATKTLTKTTYTGCSEYYDLRRSNFVRIDFTLSAGTLDLVELEIGK